jgi:hypothetical protein
LGKKHTFFLKVKWFVPNIASTYRRKQRTPTVQISAGYEVISLVATSGAVKETRYKYIKGQFNLCEIFVECGTLNT